MPPVRLPNFPGNPGIAVDSIQYPARPLERRTRRTMRCEVLPLDRFDTVASDWCSVAARYRHAPFMELDFIRPLLSTFATGDERVVKLDSGSDVLALGVFRRLSGRWETFQPSQLPIGCLVLQEGRSWIEVLDAIGRALPGLTIGVGMTQQDPLFCPCPTTDQGRISTLDYIATAPIEVAGTFDEYWAARGKNLRQNVRKQRRKLAEDGIAATLDIVDSIDTDSMAVSSRSTFASSPRTRS